jgi:hypothetical protein
MSTPYRDAPEAVEVEPLPAFRKVPHDGLVLSVLTAIILMLAVPDWLNGRGDAAIAFVACYLAALAVGVLGAALEPLIRAWLDRRYARKVARGIAELEARAAR